MRERYANWGLRVLALGLAIFCWFFFSLDRRTAERLAETTIEASVQYNNTPSDLIILDPVEKVRVRVRGPVGQISTLNPMAVGAVVDMRDTGEGERDVPLGADNLLLPQGLEVLSINPNLLSLTLDRVVTEMRPVNVRWSGEPAAGAIVKEATVMPSSVALRGPVSKLAEVDSLLTRPLRLDGHAIDFEEPVVVVSPDPLIQIPQPVVIVRVRLEIPQAVSSTEGVPSL